MGHPDRDPHSEPIPNGEWVMPADKGAPLPSVQPEQEAAVRRVHAQDLGLPQDLGELAPILGAHLKTLLVSP